jgi:1,6-anhydro-N-acetylmuramate kinase
MSGTSLDGVDAVLLRLRGRGFGMGLDEMLDAVSVPLGGGQVLARLAQGGSADAASIAGACLELGKSHQRACRTLCERAGIERPDLVCAHGQTVWHAPPVGWQAFNPWPIADDLRCPVVYDLRSADLNAGGQGAPITPLADWVLFRHPEQNRLIVNLGGFCNVTNLPAGEAPGSIRAKDLCACNQVLDAAARVGIGRAFDPDGAYAARGRVEPQAEAELFAVLLGQSLAGRSLGSGDEAGGWVDAWARRLGGEDLLATACRGVAMGIAAGLAGSGSGAVYVGGGSARNATLMRELERTLGGPVRRTDDLGVAAPWREGACFAVLGLLAMDGVEITLPGVTGRRGPIPLSGAWILPPHPGPTPHPPHRPTAGMS